MHQIVIFFQPKVFLSYSRDDEDRAQDYHNAFEAKNIGVIWDKDIDNADRWDPEIDTMLKQSCAVVVLWSKNSILSERVIYEASAARHSKKLVGVSMDGTKPPEIFQPFQYSSLRGWNRDVEDASFLPIVRAIDKLNLRKIMKLDGIVKIGLIPILTWLTLLSFWSLDAIHNNEMQIVHNEERIVNLHEKEKEQDDFARYLEERSKFFVTRISNICHTFTILVEDIKKYDRKFEKMTFGEKGKYLENTFKRLLDEETKQIRGFVLGINDNLNEIRQVLVKDGLIDQCSNVAGLPLRPEPTQSESRENL